MSPRVAETHPQVKVYIREGHDQVVKRHDGDGSAIRGLTDSTDIRDDLDFVVLDADPIVAVLAPAPAMGMIAECLGINAVPTTVARLMAFTPTITRPLVRPLSHARSQYSNANSQHSSLLLRPCRGVDRRQPAVRPEHRDCVVQPDRQY